VAPEFLSPTTCRPSSMRCDLFHVSGKWDGLRPEAELHLNIQFTGNREWTGGDSGFQPAPNLTGWCAWLLLRTFLFQAWEMTSDTNGRPK